MERLGLCTANPSDRIALRGVRLQSILSAMSQQTTISQTFVNLEDRAIEALYTFPLPENAAVCRFEVITNDHVLTGVVEENDVAEEKYDQAISDGNAGFLLEQLRPDVFTTRVGNIKPRQAATIRLTYVCPLEVTDGTIRLAFPTTVAPRYVTDSGTNDPIATIVDGDAVNPPHALHVPYGLSMQVDVDLGRTVGGITSPSHRIEIHPSSPSPGTPGEGRGEGQFRVTLAGRLTEMDRDIVLSIALKKQPEPFVQVGSGREKDSFLAVTFLPEFDASDLDVPGRSETVFILDCSGSMMGDSIQQAVAALQICLCSLSEGDAFNICRFGSTFDLLASEALIYNRRTRQRALDHVRDIIDLGGTELHAPLEAILKTPPRVGQVRQIILLTDGQVSNEPALMDLARKHRGRNRIFSFGIGSACSASLVKGLARATGGASEFISAGERIDDKVLRTFSRIASPPVTDVHIDWADADVQTLAELPPLFDGDTLTVFGRSAGRAPRQVTLRCNTPRGPRSWSVQVPSARDDGGLIATMWARRSIQSLEEVNNLSRLSPSERKANRDAQALIALSKEFNLLCSLTSFIAIEHRTLKERNEGQPELRRVPVKLAAEWHGVAVCDMACAAPMAAPPVMASRAREPLLAKLARAITPKAHRAHDVASAPPAGYVGSLKSSIEPKDVHSDDHSFILSLQSAEGCFEWEPYLNEILQGFGHDSDTLGATVETALPELTPNAPAEKQAFIITALLLLLLRLHFPDRQPLWRRASRKAVAWMAKAAQVTAEQVEIWLSKLEQKFPAA